MLDLSVWMSLQSHVEQIPKNKVIRDNELAKSMLTIDDKTLKRVHDCWKLVMWLIKQGKGLNNLVKKNTAESRRKDLKKDLPTLHQSNDKEDQASEKSDDGMRVAKDVSKLLNEEISNDECEDNAQDRGYIYKVTL